MNRRTRLALPQGEPATIPGVMNGQYWTFYDYQPYPAAGVGQINFFQTPKGQNGRTEEDTNFPGAGVLPQGMQFVLQSVMVDMQPGAAVAAAAFGAPAVPNYVNDVHNVMQRGYLEFQYSSMNLIEDTPLKKFPMDTRVQVDAALSDATTPAANLATRVAVAYASGKPYRVADVKIESLVNFSFRIAFPNGVVPLPSAAAARLGVHMVGVLRRRAQ